MSETDNLKLATFGAGCFWCVEAIFQNIRGVSDISSGYMGGELENPRYKEVCYGNTGHAEVIQMKFDPSIISYEQLLEVFWTTHDPTTLNRQGNDVGTQYRSVVFYHDENQKQIAKSVKEQFADKIWDGKVVTEISEASTYYIAESYHQDYYRQNENAGYCRLIINPKLQKFKKQYAELLVNT